MNDPIAYIDVVTADGEVADRIVVTEHDHINLKEYLDRTYEAVNMAARMQGGAL